MSEILSVNSLSKSFTGITSNSSTFKVLDGVSFGVNQGEIVSIIGSTGSGKTTLLNLISGIEKPESGIVSIDTNIKVGYVFQSNAVFPWRTVEGNLSYPLELKNKTKHEIAHSVHRICALINFEAEILLNKYPKELSGGENRRLALGMVLAFEADLILLDEPTSQLDYFTACSIQNTITRIQNELNLTVVVVTHDLEEAVYLSNRVLVLKEGKINADFNVVVSRQKNDNIRDTIEFLNIKKQIRNLLRNDG